MLSIHPYCIAVDELPKVEGSIRNMAAQNSDDGIVCDGVFSSWLDGSSLHPTSGTSPKYDSAKMQFGGNKVHNNIQPSYSCYMWRRVS